MLNVFKLNSINKLISNTGIGRFIGSHSLDELNTTADLSKRTANEILDKYKGKAVPLYSLEGNQFLDENNRQTVKVFSELRFNVLLDSSYA